MTQQVYKKYPNDPTSGGFTVVNTPVASNTVAGATSSTPAAIYGIRGGYSITAFPTVAGTAVIKMSTSAESACMADVLANNFTSGQAKWVDWTTGAVTALSQEFTLGAITAAAIVPSSGTWTLEVCG